MNDISIADPSYNGCLVLSFSFFPRTMSMYNVSCGCSTSKDNKSFVFRYLSLIDESRSEALSESSMQHVCNDTMVDPHTCSLMFGALSKQPRHTHLRISTHLAKWLTLVEKC